MNLRERQKARRLLRLETTGLLGRRGTTLLGGVRLPTDERVLPLVRRFQPFGRLESASAL